MVADIHSARAEDVDALVVVENAVFEGDRISYRSFCQMIDHKTAQALVAESLSGYVMVMFRKGSSVACVYSFAVALDFSGKEIGSSLLDAAERIAYEHGRMMRRLEVREDNARAIRLNEQNASSQDRPRSLLLRRRHGGIALQKDAARRRAGGNESGFLRTDL